MFDRGMREEEREREREREMEKGKERKREMARGRENYIVSFFQYLLCFSAAGSRRW